MNRNVMRGLLGAAFVGGLWAAGTAVASAADVDDSSHDSGSTSTIVQLPVTIAGNAVAGDDAGTTGADTSSTAAATADATAASSDASSDDEGLLSGGSSAAILSVPITVSGNAVSVAGDSTSEGATTSVAAPAESTSSSGASDGTASDGSSAAIVSAPITVSGNAVSVLGDAHSEGAATTVEAPSTAESHATGSESSWSDDEGLLSGGSSAGIVSAPITVSGNAVSVLGDAHSQDAATTVEAPAEATSHATGSSDDESLLSDGSSAVATAAPITIAGNAVSGTGDAYSEGAATEVHAPAWAESHATGASDDEGLLSGGSSAVSTSAPVTIGGNAVSGTGDAWSEGASTTVEAPATAESHSTGASDDEGLLSGGSSAVGTSAPVTIGGNAVAGTGDAYSEGAVTEVHAPATAESHAAGASDDEGLLSGGSSAIATSAPVTVGGNAVSGLGDAHSEGAVTWVEAPAEATSHSTGSSDDESLLSNGSSAVATSAPITLGGNAVAVTGDAWSEGAETTVEAPATAESHSTGASDDEGLPSGASSAVGTSAPVTIGGNAVSGTGDAHSEGATTEVHAPAWVESHATGASDDEGLLSRGSSAIATAAPITIGGNAVAVTGDAWSEGAETTVVAPATATSDGTSNDEGILGGGVSTIETVAPVTIGGNAVSVLGDATTTGSTTTVVTEPMVPTDPMTPSEPTDPGTDTPSTGGPTTDAPTTGEAPTGVTPAAVPTAPEKADAVVSDPSTSSASLPVTGAELGGLALGLALAAMLLGMLLLLGARLRTQRQRD